jgi:hypothetical protein
MMHDYSERPLPPCRRCGEDDCTCPEVRSKDAVRGDAAHQIAMDYARHIAPESAERRGDFYAGLAKDTSDTELRELYTLTASFYYHAGYLVRCERNIPDLTQQSLPLQDVA